MEPVGPSRVERRLAAIRDRPEVPKHLHGLQTESRLSRSLRHEPYFAQLPANAEKPGVGGGLRSPAQRRERAVEVVARCGGGRREWPPPDLPTCSRHPGFTARATASRDDPKRASVFYETASPARVSPDSLVEESGFEPAVPLCERIGLSGKNADASQTTRMGLERVGHVAGPRVANVEDSGSCRPRRLLKPEAPTRDGLDQRRITFRAVVRLGSSG